MIRSSDETESKIARLLCELADLSGDGAALEACRREAADFEPALAVAGVVLDQLAAETDAEGFGESCTILDRLHDRFQAQGEVFAAVKLIEGLTRIGAAQTDRESAQARRLRQSLRLWMDAPPREGGRP